MVKALISDLSRVLLFPKDPLYQESLNQLYKKHKDEKNFSFFNYFYLNQELLDYLATKNQIELAIFTSDTIQEASELNPLLVQVFSHIFSAAKFGFNKQDPEAYLKLCELLKLEVHEVVYVDDVAENVEAAERAGLTTLHYQNNQSTIQELESLLSRKDFNYHQYDDNYEQYLASNADGHIGGNDPRTRVSYVSKYATKGVRVFEIGSGGGKDAEALVHVGYNVTASDYLEKFVDAAKNKGLKAILFDAKKDILPEAYDMVYANAVFVHFSPLELRDFLTRIKPQLVGPQVVFMTVIQGEGHERSARSRGFERDFYYYNVDSLEKILEESGYVILDCDVVDDKWLQVIAGVRN